MPRRRWRSRLQADPRHTARTTLASIQLIDRNGVVCSAHDPAEPMPPCPK
jgi:hypothetical protein